MAQSAPRLTRLRTRRMAGFHARELCLQQPRRRVWQTPIVATPRLKHQLITG
ncbi:hypothetical protein KCP74_11440 [Salmonella enterica subsp. enterica]|nr:hypothetical protein KCP74_11440 [Salmonella enterica subsp. enterica]